MTYPVPFQSDPDQQGPSSVLASPFPTTCFADTVLNPLPVYLYLLCLPLAFILSHRYRDGGSGYNGRTAHMQPTRGRRLLHKAASLGYYAAIVINILMQTLEVVRLCLESFGVGLLPFNYVGLLFGLVLHATDGIKGRIQGRLWKGLNVFLWVGMMIVTLVKLAGLVNMEHNGIYRSDSKYPMTDWVTDVAVIAAVYLFLAVMELWLGVWKRERNIIVGGGDILAERPEK